MPLFQRRRKPSNGATASILEQNEISGLLFQRRTEALESFGDHQPLEQQLRLYFRRDWSLQTELLPPFYRRREPSNGATASILAETGAFKRSYCLFYRRREPSNGATTSILEDFGFWLPKWRFFGCRLSAFLVADSALSQLPTQSCRISAFGCRLRLVLVADSALFWLPTHSCRLRPFGCRLRPQPLNPCCLMIV